MKPLHKQEKQNSLDFKAGNTQAVRKNKKEIKRYKTQSKIIHILCTLSKMSEFWYCAQYHPLVRAA